jgi:hypothetical protein
MCECSLGCLLTDSELLILFAENSQILVKILVIPILLTFIYLVALNLLVNNQLNSLSNSTHHYLRQKLGTNVAHWILLINKFRKIQNL